MIYRVSIRNEDEILCFQPKVICSLQHCAFNLEQFVRLPSGKVIDLVGFHTSTTYVIECKPKLSGGKFFGAVGQALCYAAEHHPTSIPAIATYTSSVNDYIRKSCRTLGITIFEVED
jgi:hypothetical protein